MHFRNKRSRDRASDLGTSRTKVYSRPINRRGWARGCWSALNCASWPLGDVSRQNERANIALHATELCLATAWVSVERMSQQLVMDKLMLVAQSDDLEGGAGLHAVSRRTNTCNISRLTGLSQRNDWRQVVMADSAQLGILLAAP